MTLDIKNYGAVNDVQVDDTTVFRSTYTAALEEQGKAGVLHRMKQLCLLVIYMTVGFVLTTLLFTVLGCASVDRDESGSRLPEVGEFPDMNIRGLEDSACYQMPPNEAEVCDDQLVCHGSHCYVRCCSDSECEAGESCRWGVCRSGQGWGE